MDLNLIGGPDEHAGEIVISGPQLAVGYWQNPEQTARSFRTVELDGKPTRAYFTGDWAKRSSGHVFCKGRLDFQVKIHGHRLELDEVAAAIRECGWPEVCVLMWRDVLTAVIEAREGAVLNEGQLRRSLAKKLEHHAIPVVLRTIQSLPRNENDKIDSASVAKWLEAKAGPAAVPSTRVNAID
jgi:acyl-coenzyme A synthetase/AMP-(fatty) acid ligase